MLKEKIDQMTTGQLAKLYELIQQNGDHKNAQKILELYEKKKEDIFTISFSGHFSAGKSSLLNCILEKEVLPKSPIPTSANIVKITSGEGVARIFFNNKKTVQYEEPYDIDMIKDYCMNRDMIKQIEISTSEHILPSKTFLVDTPGIDAADDADRLMTESSLHIIDQLFYVMDYNHVQSEVNLYFLQEIQKQNIPYYIIINQIDKHNEEEISFSSFHERVNQTFVQWNLKPTDIFYSSAIDEAHEYNELNEIKSLIYQLLNQKDDQPSRIKDATEKIIKDHKQFLQESFNEKLIDIDDETNDESLSSLKEQVELYESSFTEFENKFTEEIDVTLNNAYLMPANLREKARSFLESQQNDFKVGRFFRVKRRTKEERKRRLNLFLTQLQETIESTITWRLRDKLSELLRENELHDDHLYKFIQNLNITYTDEDLLQLVNPGATINGNYILNYTNEICSHIKRRFRNKTNDLLENIESIIDRQNKAKINELNEQIKIKEETFKQHETNRQLLQQLNGLKEAIDHTFSIDDYDESYIKNELEKTKEVVIEDVPIIEKQKESLIENIPYEKDENLSKQPKLEIVIQTIDSIVDEITELPGFSTIASDLKEKRSRLYERDLTIALFGAFSAGKSSFSNALFGEQILPVSPNPTTAVINRISPINDQHTHGTVIITLKTNEQLVHDIKLMIPELNGDDFHRLIYEIKEERLYEADELSHIYQAYLQALIDGYNIQKNHIGKEITISLKQFSEYVTNESKACYIESVDLFYDCEVTRQGITIVDTPGADSINVRHTNVAFDYIKYADAILYVTYYNHAITKADRDFLIQLGRVKESFELDKMFFIVNAADLAKDEDELQLVLDYVEKQLLELGIRFPNIYPVSSKRSLEEKQNNEPLNEQMKAFETTFYSFIHEDLTKLTIQSAVWDMKRAHQTLTNYINTVNLDEQARKKLKTELLNKQDEIKAILESTNHSQLKEQLNERIKRQLHYVNERLFIRFHSMFTDYFNPTTITQSGQKGMAQVRRKRNEFIDYVGYELLQEIRAVSLRIESYINTLLAQFHAQLEEAFVKVDDRFIIGNFVNKQFITPDYEQAFLDLDKNIFNRATRLFRGTKSFFEQNEREHMKDMFYEILNPHAIQYIEHNEHVMKEYYKQEIERLMTKLEEDLDKEVDVIVNNQLTMIDDSIDVELLINKENIVKEKLELVNH